MTDEHGPGSTPDLAMLADYVEGRLDTEQAARVRAALEVDAELRASERWVRGFVRASAEAAAAYASPLATQQLRQHFVRWARAQAALGESVVRYRAELVFDSRAEVRLVGVRGEARDVSLVFGSEIADVAVDLLPGAHGRIQLLGQVMLNADTDAPYFAASALVAGVRHKAESDELGRFRLDDLPAAPAELRVSNGEVEISVTIPLGSVSGG